MKVHRVLSHKDLDDNLRSLIDANKALPPDVQFFESPEATKKGAVVWVILAVVSAVLAVVCFALAKPGLGADPRSGEYDFSQMMIKGAAVCALLTIGWVWKAVVDFKRARAADKDAAKRNGLFLLPEALLVWGDFSRMFPRDSIQEYSIERTEKDGIVFINSNLKFTTNEGGTDTIRSIEGCVVTERREAAANAIKAWGP